MHENRDWPGEKNLDYFQKQSRVLAGSAYDASSIDALGAYDLFIQAGAESDQHIPIRLPNMDTDYLGLRYIDVTADSSTSSYTPSYLDEATGAITSGSAVTQTTDGASRAIEQFKGALAYVSGERSRMGAYQNRLEHTMNNLDNIVENTTAAESSIRDTDMSSDMVAFSNNSILIQAGQSMLSQANQSNQGVLSLLG